MKDDEIIKLWRSGLNKFQVANFYGREYNHKIKRIRLDRKHRKEKFMTKQEALSYVERIILKYLRNES